MWSWAKYCLEKDIDTQVSELYLLFSTKSDVLCTIFKEKKRKEEKKNT